MSDIRESSEGKAKKRGSKHPLSYPPDTDLDAFSQRPTRSPPQCSDQPADLFSAELRPTPPQSQSDGCGIPERVTNERETKLPSTDRFPPNTVLKSLCQYQTFSRSQR